MRNICRNIATTVVLLLPLLLAKDSRASHAMGADLTYQCLGNNQYVLTYILYRDCSGIPAPASISIVFVNNCGGPGLATVSLPPIVAVPPDVNPTQISPVCSSATSTCDNGTFTGIMEWIYSDTITLPAGCNNWTIYHSENARNAAITTIGGAGSDDLFVYSTINNLNGLCNSSPIFSNKPVPFACVGQRLCFNHGAYDPDGDSLSYQLIAPRTGPNPADSVQYLGGLTSNQPLNSVPPMTFNPATGDFCITPQSQEVTVMAVLVREWRNGVMIGEVERDIQITVLPCQNQLPTLSGINGTPFFNRTVCAGNELCFYMFTSDLDFTDTTLVTWDQSIPGATFNTLSGARRDSAYFCWTPSASQISNTPYCFTATVSDNSCPYIGIQVYSFCITVIGVDPDAGTDQTIPCGATANLSGSATGGNGTFAYTWHPGAIPGQTLNNVGLGTYILEVQSATCTNWDTVQVLPGLGNPNADFSFTLSCLGTPVQFTDLSTVQGSTIASWSWDFGDGNSSTSQNPSHLYGSNGTYTVTLTVSTPTNCTSTYIQQVSFNTNIPTAQFATNNVCDGAPMNFQDQSIGGPITSWAWDFGDPGSGSNTSNAQHPAHTFTAPGTYSVTLNVVNQDGCTNQSSQSVTVNANPVFTVTDQAICEGATATLNGPPGFSSYQWSSGQSSSSISVSPLLTTSYSLTATDGNGCVGNTSATVTVNPVPIPDAGFDQTICEGTTANLAGTGGNNYEWNPGALQGQNVTVTPNISTTYTLTVSSNAGCSATDLVTVNVNPMPLASAGNDIPICDGESATINAAVGAGTILWTPGNFNTASITVNPNVTTTYTLLVSDAIGCSGTDDITVVVSPLPDAAFVTAPDVCLNFPSNFTDGSTVASGNITTWLWSFGDGQISNSQNPVHTYSTAGVYPVGLLVVTNGGCMDSVMSSTTVNPLPVADAGDDASICPGFNATLTGNGGVNYLWNPGAYPTSSITLSPPVTTVYTLTVTDGNGCINSDIATIVVNPVPDASAGADQSLCLGESTTIHGTGGTDYMWTPGNVNSSAYNITPAASTTYTVLVTNSFGCQATDEVYVQINPIPVAAMSSSGAICEDNPVSFTDQSTVASGNIIAWNWDFGNSMSSSNQNPTIPYYDFGNYDVMLVIYSDNGCTDTSHIMQTIWAKPDAGFIHNNVCDGNPIAFTNSSSIVDASPLVYNWNLGDSYTSTSIDVTHQYTSYGAYAATLVVTSVNGCMDTYNSLVNVYALPDAHFSVDYSCEDSPAEFIDQSTIPQGVISNWFWSFGDGRTTTESHPFHIYTDDGDYGIHMRIASDHGCLDSTDGDIRVVPKPVVDFLAQNACLGYEIELTDMSSPVTGPIVQYRWTFGDGNESGQQNPTYTYSSPGWFEVSLTATTDSGCSETVVRPNAVNIYAPPQPQFISNATDANDIYPMVYFHNQTPAAEIYYWSFGDGDTSSAVSPTHLYPDVGVYDVQLIAIDLNGCIDSTLLRIEIKPTSNIYIPNAFSPNGDTKNDFFQVYSYNVVSMEVQIYDRWGIKIVEWDGVGGTWDGSINGDPAQSDTYVYRVATTDVNAKKEVHIGHVSLVR